ncbi:MAG: cytochrome D1 domain-containing protein [Gemmatimonadota bacterium]
MRFRLAALGLIVTLPLGAQTLVISNMNNTTAQLIDIARGAVVATLPTTSVPHEVAVSPNGKWAVVTDYGAQQPGSTVTLIDVATAKVAKTISFAPYQRPHGAVFLNDNKTLVLTAERDSLLVLMDVEAGKIIATRRTGQRVGHMVAIPRDQRTAYVANITAGTLSIVDLAGTADPVVIKVGTQTEGIGVSPDGRSVWMGSNNTGKVYIVDAVLRKVVDSVQTSGTPYRIAFTPDGKLAIVTNPEQDEIHLYDVASHAERAKVKITSPDGKPVGPQGIIISPDGSRAWITMGTANYVAEYLVPELRSVRQWDVAAGPDGIAWSSQQARP